MSHQNPDVLLREHGAATVLIVDDDEAIRETLKDCLGDEGFSAAVVENGQQALDYLESVPVPPRLILLDLMMPIMDGWEVLNRLRMNEAFAAIPLVIISAFYARSGRATGGSTMTRARAREAAQHQEAHGDRARRLRVAVFRDARLSETTLRR